MIIKYASKDDNLFIVILIGLGISLTMVVGTNINVCWYSISLTKWFIRIVIWIESYI